MRIIWLIILYIYYVSASSIRSMLKGDNEDFSLSADDSPELTESKVRYNYNI